MSIPLSILTWNVNRGTATALDPLAALPDRPDIVTLQEVTLEQAGAIRERLHALGYKSAYSGNSEATDKRYGNVIAARMPLSSKELAVSDLPWPQLVSHAVLDTHGGPINVVTVHVPNGSRNGWKKISTLEALKRMVLGFKGTPLVLTGDFNEPMWVPPQDGHIVTAGQEDHDGRWLPWSTWTFDGVSDSGERWDAAVRWFFEDSNASGIRNAFWDVAGHGKMEPSHFSQGAERWFDHVFISDCFRVVECGYLHAFRENGFSDHSALVATMSHVSG